MNGRRVDAFDDSNEEWQEGAEHAAGGYSEDDDFDYEEYVEREFGKQSAGPKAGSWKKWTWRVVVVVICLLLIWRFLLY